MEWQPIETAPKDGTPILACLSGECYTGHGFLPVCVRWETFHPNSPGKATWRASHGYKVAHLTHWMPLPPPPAASVPDGLIDALRHQRQIDEDGQEVGVSRQAVDEAANILAVLAAQENPNG